MERRRRSVGPLLLQVRVPKQVCVPDADVNVNGHENSRVYAVTEVTTCDEAVLWIGFSSRASPCLTSGRGVVRPCVYALAIIGCERGTDVRCLCGGRALPSTSCRSTPGGMVSSRRLRLPLNVICACERYSELLSTDFVHNA